MLKSRVFVSNYAGHDISNAFHYTSLPREKAQVYITEGSVNIFNSSRLIYDIKLKLQDSEPEDFLLFSGNGFIFGLVLSMWLEKHGKANLLLYHQGDKRYCLRYITQKEMQ